MSSAAAEKLVKELARKPSNAICANCGTQKKFGFSTVCIKYHTFVCSNCKSSHQAISHRCKSLTMSSWTDQEVAELKRKGNDYARRTWLKNAPPVGQGGRPKEGDSIDTFKRFVVEAYERKRYYGEDDGAAPAPMAAPAPASRPSRPTRAPVRRAVPPPAPAPAAPVADLLDFSAASSAPATNTFEANFDAFAPATPSASVTPAKAPVQNDPFAAQGTPASTASGFNFINNSNSTTPSTATPKIPAIKKPVMSKPSPTAASNASAPSGTFQANFDAFAASSSKPVSAPSTSSAPVQNDPFQPTATQTTNAAGGSGFSFINGGTTTPAVPAVKKPVMNNASMCQKSSLISSMDMSSVSSNTQQGRLNMSMGMGMPGMGQNNNMANNPNAFGGMGNMNQMMMMQQQQMNMMNGMMNGMSLNNNGMGMGMVGNNNMMMGGTNPMMMMGNNNNMMMNQQAMMNGNGFGNQKGNKSNNASNMQSLQMNMSSMNAWTSGK